VEATSAIRIRSWQRDALRESHDVGELAAIVGTKSSRTWIDLAAPDPELIRETGRQLGLHPLIADDIVESNERAKVLLVGDVIHVVAFVLARDPALRIDEIDFVLGPGFLLSVHPAPWQPEAAHQLKLGVGPILGHGPDRLLWALVDSIVDGYFPVFDGLGDEIDDVQDAVMARPDPATLEHVFQLKRELLRIRHVVGPSREVFAQLTSREFDLIAEANVFYFRDVYDHLIRLNDELDSYRELVGGALEIYLSTINNNLSTIMRRLTGVTVILAGIGAVAGVFGMSEAATAVTGTEAAGFYLVVLITVVAALVATYVLRRVDWL
jgi:magnesium transporter